MSIGWCCCGNMFWWVSVCLICLIIGLVKLKGSFKLIVSCCVILCIVVRLIGWLIGSFGVEVWVGLVFIGYLVDLR